MSRRSNYFEYRLQLAPFLRFFRVYQELKLSNRWLNIWSCGWSQLPVETCIMSSISWDEIMLDPLLELRLKRCFEVLKKDKILFFLFIAWLVRKEGRISKKTLHLIVPAWPVKIAGRFRFKHLERRIMTWGQLCGHMNKMDLTRFNYFTGFTKCRLDSWCCWNCCHKQDSGSHQLPDLHCALASCVFYLWLKLLLHYILNGRMSPFWEPPARTCIYMESQSTKALRGNLPAITHTC